MTLSIFFSLTNTFEVALQYLFNVFILFNTVFYLKFNFKLKIDPKICTFKNLEEILKTWKNFEKTSGNPGNVTRSKIIQTITRISLLEFVSFTLVSTTPRPH